MEMPQEERRLRMQRMRATVRERNIYRWAGSLISELCEIRTPQAGGQPRLVWAASASARESAKGAARTPLPMKNDRAAPVLREFPPKALAP
jgi:trehalose-6-phosphate synthase